ncbi:MAG: hypothetical protein OEV95_08060 [Gemmatimonadota bacterium]|nr:hypothetical protein [Gemmatimonadota bacterium]MDH5283829.1 hypothetical protein [Gemmatimonadota bacterium]
MTRPALGLALVLALSPASLHAQLGEVHVGLLASYGTAGSYQAGGGLLAGVSAGRLVYLGVRWVYFAGDTEQRSDPQGQYDVTTRAQIFAADLGLQYPTGPVEIVAGVTIGATRYGQETDPLGSGGTAASTSGVATELLVAPNLSVQIRALGLLVIPEVMYPLSGAPDLRWPADRKGAVFALRLVVPFEVQRVRW